MNQGGEEGVFVTRRMRKNPEFVCHLCGSVAAVVLFLFCGRAIVWKLADQVMVRADVNGFTELAAGHPWGAVDWACRFVAAMNLVGWGLAVNLALVAGAGALAFLALRRCRSPLSPFAPWFAASLFVLPALSLGDQVWLVPRPHFPQLHLVWFAILAVCLLAERWGLLVFAALQVVLIVLGALGYHDLPAFETMRSAWSLPLQVEWGGRDALVVAVFVAFAAACFVRRPAAFPRWAQAVPPALVAALCLCCWPKRSCIDQLDMERAVREQRFEDVLKVASRKARPERMETAWRILAMFRTDKLDRNLFPCSIFAPNADTKEEEMVMEGPLLLFQYGLVLPARRWTYETITVKGWQPQYLQLLGDIAVIVGEVALARKNYRELARCPFRGDFAERRLRALERESQEELSDLLPVAALHEIWSEMAKTTDLKYQVNERYVERLVYAYFLQLKACPPPIFKMVLVSALLEGRPEFLRDNLPALQQLYPDGRIAPVFLEALK